MHPLHHAGPHCRVSVFRLHVCFLPEPKRQVACPSVVLLTHTTSWRKPWPTPDSRGWAAAGDVQQRAAPPEGGVPAHQRGRAVPGAVDDPGPHLPGSPARKHCGGSGGGADGRGHALRLCHLLAGRDHACERPRWPYLLAHVLTYSR